MTAPAGAELREGDSSALRRRRRIIGLATFATADFLVGSLYQTGVVRRLPDPPLPGVDSMAVMRSPAAYPFGNAPVAAIVVVGGLVLARASARKARQARR